MMPLGIISDEVSDDLAHACERIRSWDLAHVELRQAWGKNIVRWTGGEVDRAAAIVRDHDLTVTAIASPVFKSPLDERPREQEADFALEGVESMEAQLELLERSCELANRFGTRFVRVFTFWREPWTDDAAERIARNFARAAEVARSHDVVLAVENEPVCIVGTGRELGRVCTLLEERLPEGLRPHVGALWDPGNALAGGEDDPFPGGYEALAGCRLVHVHLKDLVPRADEAPSFVPLGEGAVDYRGQFERLRADGYDGTLVLEPHYAPSHMSKEEAAHACVGAARVVLGSAPDGTD